MLHEEARDLSQHLVAGRPAVLLVELLEVVDVEDDQRQRMPEARVALDLFLDPQREVAPVVELGEAVLEREVLESCVADRHRRLGRERADQLLVLAIERHDRAGLVEGVQELEHADDAAVQVLERHDQHRPGRVVAGGVDPLVEPARLLHADGVGVGDVDELPGLRDVAGQARLAQLEGLGLEQSLGLVLAELALEEVVLDDREAEVLTVPQEQRARLGPGEPSRLVEDAVEQRVQIALVRERDADLDQLRQQLFAIDHGARLSAPRRGSGRCALRRRALDRRPR